MISQLLFMLLAAAPADRINDARRAYSTCLTGLVKSELDAKTEPAAFEGKLATACQSERAAFRDAIVAVDVSAGIKRPVAEENAATEIEDFISNAKESYRDYFETKTRPG
ncbi:hypothetical protein [Sphingosinicella rhizophila]|uniref:UrcA family protein n=1 Tax=Sphingosinicella rhizophila TaxID=3050082 RepID=A0ABU3Q8H5_9SPHN|nr:hypothetical protein [Sphingosinicella sp. GR2756]MDT9599711.1 hypothetical protein [Sphingosinicella sp. GR2756]